MQFVRLTAALVRQHSLEPDARTLHATESPPDAQDCQLVLVGALDADDELVRGEWMGYLTFGEAVRPFVLHGARMVFGQGPQGRWESTLHEMPLRPGAVFSLGDHHSRTVWTYEVRGVFSYGHLHG